MTGAMSTYCLRMFFALTRRMEQYTVRPAKGREASQVCVYVCECARRMEQYTVRPAEGRGVSGV